MCVWLDVSCLCNSESVGVHNSLAGRNVQRRLLHQYMCVCLDVLAFVIQDLWMCQFPALVYVVAVVYVCVGVSCLRNSESVVCTIACWKKCAT